MSNISKSNIAYKKSFLQKPCLTSVKKGNYKNMSNRYAPTELCVFLFGVLQLLFGVSLTRKLFYNLDKMVDEVESFLDQSGKCFNLLDSFCCRRKLTPLCSGYRRSLTMVPAGNKVKHLSSVNHITKTIHHPQLNKWSIWQSVLDFSRQQLRYSFTRQSKLLSFWLWAV